MKLRDLTICVNLLAFLPEGALAHVSEGGFVLLLPTAAYTAAGVAVVALTVVALFALPARFSHAAFHWHHLPERDFGIWREVTSLISFALMIFVIYLGLNGPRSPLSNLMPLSFWTLGWIVSVSLALVFGNLWSWLNPWTGFYWLIGVIPVLVKLPKSLGLWPVTALLIGFAAFLLADIAPDDPGRLARFVVFYWTATFLGMVICGRVWLNHFELGHAIFASYASLAPVQITQPAGVGGPGWQLLNAPQPRGAGVFALTLLAVGSFDGINETYWWLGQIGVNPLEFPGRSAVVQETLAGLSFTLALLFAIFALTVWLGLKISQSDVAFTTAFSALALSILPIAAVYHIAHYLTSFLVSIQYTIAAISDPFAQGADLLGIAPFRVTTGFFNSIDSVRLIWITQAGLVVLGHVWSVLLSHRMALRLFGNNRRAAIATLPLSILMIAYTLLGLWLLAAPKGA